MLLSLETSPWVCQWHAGQVRCYWNVFIIVQSISSKTTFTLSFASVSLRAARERTLAMSVDSSIKSQKYASNLKLIPPAELEATQPDLDPTSSILAWNLSCENHLSRFFRTVIFGKPSLCLSARNYFHISRIGKGTILLLDWKRTHNSRSGRILSGEFGDFRSKWRILSRLCRSTQSCLRGRDTEIDSFD